MDGNWHTSNKATIWRWRSAYQNDFAARMDWTIKPYADANHPPVPTLNHANRLSATSGARVNLSADGSTDPDGNALTYQWLHYANPARSPNPPPAPRTPEVYPGALARHPRRRG